MKAIIVRDSWYPYVLGDHANGSFEVPDALYKRHLSNAIEFENIQTEIAKLYQASKDADPADLDPVQENVAAGLQRLIEFAPRNHQIGPAIEWLERLLKEREKRVRNVSAKASGTDDE